MANWLSWRAAVVVAAAQGVLALAVLRFGSTGPIAMHFNLSGAVDRWGDRTQAAGTVAVTLAGGLTLGPLTRRLGAPGDAALPATRGVLFLITCLASAFMAALGFRLIDSPAAGGMGMMAMVGTLLAATGAYLGKVGPNPVVGVRTPWTFASRLAWDKSNRLAGRLLFWGGLAGLACAPLAPQPAGFQTLIAGAAVAAVVVIFESWRVWRGDPDRRTAF